MQKTDLEKVGLLVHELELRGLKPVLVGGMALVLLGSQRVTRDFDFLVSRQEETIEGVIEVFYKHG
ncbi:MAG TPA: hypothetical protein DF383_03530, partial [Deltaproteobacteria bacterium]|nr:hypothetical protein [Deltaproteobacteria bacterium]